MIGNTIEPLPSSLECLRRNLEPEIRSGKVIVYPKGAWNKDDVLEMDANEESFVFKASKDEIVKLPLTTIDAIAKELALPKVDFIKMDIEGSEREALAGASETIRRFHPRMAICVYHLPDDPVILPDIIRSVWAGYKQQCGSCILPNQHIIPEVYFYF